MAWDKTPWPPLVELTGGMAGHLLALERHEPELPPSRTSHVRRRGGRALGSVVQRKGCRSVWYRPATVQTRRV